LTSQSFRQHSSFNRFAAENPGKDIEIRFVPSCPDTRPLKRKLRRAFFISGGIMSVQHVSRAPGKVTPIYQDFLDKPDPSDEDRFWMSLIKIAANAAKNCNIRNINFDVKHQEVMFVFLMNLEKIKAATDPFSYAKVTARNFFHRLHREQTDLPFEDVSLSDVKNLEDGTDHWMNSKSDELNSFQSAYLQDMTEKLDDAVRSLPNDEKNVIKLYFGLWDCGQLTMKEIANVMDLPISTVFSIKERALARMHGFLSPFTECAKANESATRPS
jgi:RNA polymerase sigma factor (sigma-70 family)